MSDYGDDDIDNVDYESDDESYNDSDDDLMLQDGVDNSGKLVEKANEENEDELKRDAESDDEDKPNEKPIEKRRFVTEHRILQFSEYSRTLSKIATAISDSTLRVPRGFEELLECETGDAIRIARNWIKHRKTVPLPATLYRGFHGFVSEKIDYGDLKTIDEASFEDLNEGGNYFDTCFRKDGYVN